MKPVAHPSRRAQARAPQDEVGDIFITSWDEALPRMPRFLEAQRYAFLREKNALNAATASMERIRSPNKWLS